MTQQKTTEPLDVDACVENLGIYAAKEDARSCRDVGIALADEVQRLRDQLGLVRDALRRAGFGVDDVAGDDLAGMIDRYDQQARDCVRTIGAETARLRGQSVQRGKALETVARLGTNRAADCTQHSRKTLARLWQQIADIANQALTKEG